MGNADRAVSGMSVKKRVARLLLPAECWIGNQVSSQICAHHRRRLRKIGWETALDATGSGWAPTGAPVRSGNSVDVLIDGAEALPAIAAEMRAALSHIHVTGWCFTPGFALERDGTPVVLRELLAKLANHVDVRVLAWAGAPLPLFHPSRKDVRAMRDELIGGSAIRCELDAHERPMHCHHEKTIVIDDRVAFVGGIDLTTETGDRFDTNQHPARAALGWHDVSARIEGPAVADVAEHFRMRWHEVCGERLAPVKATHGVPGGVELQIVRTVPEHIYSAVPRGDFAILETYLKALRSAQRFVYLENQFVWSPEIVNVLAGLLLDPPSPDFRILIVLPTMPMSGADTTRGMLAKLIEADDGAGRIVASALYARSGARADPIYVHAKVGVIDDHWLTIGSANLNEHSLFNDTEMNIVSHEAPLATEVRLRLWVEHLERPLESLRRDPIEVIDELWKPISKEQFERREADLPLTHRLVLLPGLSRHSSRTLGPLTGMLVDG